LCLNAAPAAQPRRWPTLSTGAHPPNRAKPPVGPARRGRRQKKSGPPLRGRPALVSPPPLPKGGGLRIGSDRQIVVVDQVLDDLLVIQGTAGSEIDPLQHDVEGRLMRRTAVMVHEDRGVAAG